MFTGHYSAFLPIFCSGAALIRGFGERMRALGGHARTISARQTIVAATTDPMKINVMTQASINQKCDAGERPGGARRSVAAIAGTGGATLGRISSSVAGSGTASMISRTGIHSPLHRTQRTILWGGRRDAGTSYSAAQPGQVIRIEIRYLSVWTILSRPNGGAKRFRRPACKTLQPRGRAKTLQPRGRAKTFQPRGRAKTFRPRGRAKRFR